MRTPAKVQVTTHAKNEHKNVADKRNKNTPPLPATELQEGSRVQAQKPREISGMRTENLFGLMEPGQFV